MSENGPPEPLRALAARSPRLVRWLGRLHRMVYLRSDGRLLSRWFGMEIVVLETVGRRSGRRYRTPACYIRNGDALVVVPANAGADRSPGWWLNLREAGEGTAILGRGSHRVRPVEAQGKTRERLWHDFVTACPAAAEYVARAPRHVPVVILQPA